jgi:hypothetical protein
VRLGDGRQSAEEKEAGLKFAQCMSDNGVRTFRTPPDCTLGLRGIGLCR